MPGTPVTRTQRYALLAIVHQWADSTGIQDRPLPPVLSLLHKAMHWGNGEPLLPAGWYITTPEHSLSYPTPEAAQAAHTQLLEQAHTPQGEGAHAHAHADSSTPPGAVKPDNEGARVGPPDVMCESQNSDPDGNRTNGIRRGAGGGRLDEGGAESEYLLWSARERGDLVSSGGVLLRHIVPPSVHQQLVREAPRLKSGEECTEPKVWLRHWPVAMWRGGKMEPPRWVESGWYVIHEDAGWSERYDDAQAAEERYADVTRATWRAVGDANNRAARAPQEVHNFLADAAMGEAGHGVTRDIANAQGVHLADVANATTLPNGDPVPSGVYVTWLGIDGWSERYSSHDEARARFDDVTVPKFTEPPAARPQDGDVVDDVDVCAALGARRLMGKADAVCGAASLHHIVPSRRSLWTGHQWVNVPTGHYVVSASGARRWDDPDQAAAAYAEAHDHTDDEPAATPAGRHPGVHLLRKNLRSWRRPLRHVRRQPVPPMHGRRRRCSPTWSTASPGRTRGLIRRGSQTSARTGPAPTPPPT